MKTKFGSLILSAALTGMLTGFVAGCTKTSEVAGTPSTRTTVGIEIDDSIVTATVKSALLADADIKGYDIKVETRKGEVQLSGFVDKQTQIDLAVTVARGVTGVKSVQNNVGLKSASPTAGGKIDDSIVTTKVKTALLSDPSIKSLDIGVLTRQGEVQLSGFVDSQSQIDRALEVTRSVAGVGGVSNEMTIKK